MLISGATIADALHTRWGFSYETANVVQQQREVLQVLPLDPFGELNPQTLYISRVSALSQMRGKLSDLQLLCIGDAPVPVWCEYQHDLNLFVFPESITLETLLKNARQVFISFLQAKLDNASFMEACSNATNFAGLFRAAATLGNLAVILLDFNGRVLAMSHEVSTEDPLWHQIQDSGSAQSLGLYRADTRLRPMPKSNFYYQSLGGWGVQMGTLMVLCEDGAPSELMLKRIEVLVFYIESLMAKTSIVPNSEKHKFDEFVLSLLAGRTYSEETVASRLDHYCYFCESPFYVLVVQFGVRDPAQDYQELEKYLILQPGELLYYYENWAVLITSTRIRGMQVYASLENLKGFLQTHRFHMGVSQSIERFSELRQAFLQAERAISFGSLLRPDYCIHIYEDYIPYHILENCSRTTNLSNYCMQSIKNLRAYDLKNRTEPLHTLKTFLACNQNSVQTAARLFIHRNTVSYRVAKCKEIMQASLEDGEELFQVMLSIKIIEYLLAVNGEMSSEQFEGI